MPKFKVGDRVERISALFPGSMRTGIVTRVIASESGEDDMFTEYLVRFDNNSVGQVYETELRLVKAAEDSD